MQELISPRMVDVHAALEMILISAPLSFLRLLSHSKALLFAKDLTASGTSPHPGILLLCGSKSLDLCDS